MGEEGEVMDDQEFGSTLTLTLTRGERRRGGGCLVISAGRRVGQLRGRRERGSSSGSSRSSSSSNSRSLYV